MHFNIGPILVYATLITGLIALLDVIYFSIVRAKRFKIFTGVALPAIFSEKKYNFPVIGFVASVIYNTLSALFAIIITLLFRRKLPYHSALKRGIVTSAQLRLHAAVLAPHGLVSYARMVFPLLLLVLCVRSFLFEPFMIPTGSLKPTLLPGDYVLVNKFDYGLRLPLSHHKIFSIGEPKLGDVVVFHYPKNPKVYYIKRVVGVPGDRLSYIDKVLYINGRKIPQQLIHRRHHTVDDILGWSENELVEALPGKRHLMYTIPGMPAHNFYNVFVPPGNYFMMGDNRDNSEDSRDWGFVQVHDLVGKAVIIAFSKNPSTWAGIRWKRLGALVQ